MRRWRYLVVPLTFAVACSLGASTALATNTGGSAQAMHAKKKPKPKRPKIFKHADVKAEATSVAGAVVTYAPARVRNARSVRYSKRSGSLFRLGATIVTITAANRGGTTRSTFKINVVDTTAPTFPALNDVNAAQESPAGATVRYGPIHADDIVDPVVTATCSPPSGSVFPAGTTTVTCTARDRAGNTATATFKVAVTDKTAPRFGAVALIDKTVAPSSDAGATVTYGPIAATDNVDANPAVGCAPGSGSLFPIGTTTVTCTVRDAAGNTATGTFKVTVGPAKTGHWTATTSQGKAFSFDVGSTGQSIVSLSVDYSVNCTLSGANDANTPMSFVFINADATFSRTETQSVLDKKTQAVVGTVTATFAGRFTNVGAVTGTFTAHITLTSPAEECDSGTVTWTASTSA